MVQNRGMENTYNYTGRHKRLKFILNSSDKISQYYHYVQMLFFLLGIDLSGKKQFARSPNVIQL